MMALKRLKTGTRKVYWRHFSDQPFQTFTAIADPEAGAARLLFAIPAVTSATHFPTKSPLAWGFAHGFRSKANGL
jgi:hypothetical protein